MQEQTTGAVALVGSGEYTPAMDETDRFLLATRGRATLRAVLLPTASGLEPGMPQRWNDMGERHFRALGAEVTPVPLIARDDATNADLVAAMRDADLYYFSGGNPEYLVETLRETPAWEAILAGYRRGAALAGCSAGAMMLGGATLRVRPVAAGEPPRWVPGLGIAPALTILPHFDRMAGFVGPEVFRAILGSAPPGITIVGVDEDTALVHAGPGADWRVMGRQTVSVFAADGSRAVYHAGETVALPPPAV